nr:hypothetical protein [Tanacetum cinerariifolium]
ESQGLHISIPPDEAIVEYERNKTNPDNAGRCGPANAEGIVAPDVQGCSYKTFLNCKPHSFNGIEGVVGLKLWFKKIEQVFETMIEIQKMEQELWTLIVKGDDIKGKWVDHKRNNNNNINNNNNHKNTNAHYHQTNKRQEAANAYVAAPTKGICYTRNLPLWNRCKAYHHGPCPPGCGAEKSFVPTAFIPFFDSAPATLDTSYEVELAHGKSKPNGKLIYNSIMNGPYVRRLIPEPGDPDREVPVVETFHEQTDDELTKKEVKQMEADDQAIQIILMGLPEDIYATVDSCKTAQEIWNQNGYNAVQTVKNQNLNGNGNVVAARTEGNAIRNNGIQLQAKEFDFMAAVGDFEEIKEVNANCILMANLQQALTSGTQTDKPPVYDSDGAAKIHHSENHYNNDIFNLFTQEELYTELLEPILGSLQVQQNDNNVISAVSNMKKMGEQYNNILLLLRKHQKVWGDAFMKTFKDMSRWKWKVEGDCDIFDGAFRGARDEEVVVREGVVVTYSSLEMLTNSCLGGIMVSLIFLEGLVEEALEEFMVKLFEEDDKMSKKYGLFTLRA